MMTEVAMLIVGLVLGIGLFLVLGKSKGHDENQEKLIDWQREVVDHLKDTTERMDKRLAENVQAMNESKSFLASRVSSAERTVREVSMGLGKLEEATNNIQKTNKEINAFQQMLKHPKIRGGFGEVLLGNLLADVLPRDRYFLQYSFAKSGEVVDAVILLLDGYLVSVDAKFPLANYQLYVQAAEQDRRTLRNIFLRDIKKHVQDISKKYIVPDQRTLDYAFMYIPVESVYYETMVHDPEGETLWEFCLKNKVIPVSPNSFLAYLQTVLVGLRGMKVEQQAKEILQSLGQVRQDFSQFTKDFVMIGTHLNNARNRFDDSARRLDKFNNRLDQIETGEEPKLRAGEEHKDN